MFDHDRSLRPMQRPRRLRQSAAMRRLVAENRLHPANLILPLFVVEGLSEAQPLTSMPGVVQHCEQSFKQAVTAAVEAGVGAIMVFGIPQSRDAQGSQACHRDGILTRSVRWAKQVSPELVVIADLCLDEFTDHGHCGVLSDDGRVDNDATLKLYAAMAVVLAEAGSTMLGTSGMMDGQVRAVREALDHAGYTDCAILAYAAKYASAFYGPFREAVQSALQGDRRTYQQDPANGYESLREVRLDVAEGADVIMVKPALAYLDIVAQTRREVDVPVAAYVVSGEYAMIEAAAAQGAINRQAAITEALLGVRRAGATLIATYWATEVARWLAEEFSAPR